MYNANRRSKEFINGVHEFIDVAKKHGHGGFFVKHCEKSGIFHSPQRLQACSECKKALLLSDAEQRVASLCRGHLLLWFSAGKENWHSSAISVGIDPR